MAGRPDRRVSTLREYFEALLIAGVFLGFTNTFLVKTFYIPSASMEDTLLIGDHLFVNRFIFGATGVEWLDRLLPLRAVRRGDIVIFRSPERPAIDMVKRCVALPGDEVQLVDKQLYVNGQPVGDAAYAKHADEILIPSRDRFAVDSDRDGGLDDPYTVPPGHYFCLGDNRDRSHDSRFWGPVPRHFVKGRAFLIYWSYGGRTSDGTWHGWAAKLRELGEKVAGFFPRTRWGRTFELPR